MGIEPAKNVAAAAVQRDIPTLVRFFGEDLARDLAADGKRADLIIGNNVLAHVPELNGFVCGLKILLAPTGVITLEFPHCDAFDGRESIRYDLPRALLVFLPNHGSKAVRSPRAGGVSTSKNCLPMEVRSGSMPVTAKTRQSLQGNG